MNLELNAKKMKIKRSLDDTHLEYNENKSDNSFARKNTSAQNFYSREGKVKQDLVNINLPYLN